MDIDQFLDREVPDVKKASAPEDVTNKEHDADEGILNKLNQSIQKNDLLEAEKLYSQIWSKITDEKLTWSESLHTALTEVNRKLLDILVRFSSEVGGRINIINGLIARARENLKRGKNESALTIYSEIMEIYNGIPDIFLVEKRKIHHEVLILYRELRNSIDEEFFQDFSSRASQIHNYIYSAKVELQKHNIQDAIKFYTSCLTLYNTLPNGFFVHKLQLSNKILELYKEITIILEISSLKSKLTPGIEKESLRRTGLLQREFSTPETTTKDFNKKINQ